MRILLPILLVFTLCVNGVQAADNYAIAPGSVLADVSTGVAGLATNAKAYGPGTSVGEDNVDPAFIKDGVTPKNIKVTITATGGATAHNTDWTISKAFYPGPPLFGIWLYFPDITTISTGCSLLITADNFANYFQVSMGGIQAIRNGWNFFAPHRNDFAVSGTPSWSSTMTRMRLQCQGDAGKTAVYYISQTYAGFYARPQIVWTFDDNHASIFTDAAPVLEARGWRGTLFSQGQRINASQYGTLSQHQAWVAAGHEIFNHTMTHSDLSSVSADVAESEIALGEANLETNGLTPPGLKHFAYPFGNFNDTVKNILRSRGYTSARAVGGNSITPFMGVKGFEFDEYQIECTELNNSVSLLQAIAEVDQTIKYGGNLILLVHALVPGVAGASSWNVDDFKALATYIKRMEPLLTVQRYSDWFEGFKIRPSRYGY